MLMTRGDYSRLSNFVENPKASIMKSVTAMSPNLPLWVKRTMDRNIVTISYAKILLATMFGGVGDAHTPPQPLCIYTAVLNLALLFKIRGKMIKNKNHFLKLQPSTSAPLD